METVEEVMAALDAMGTEQNRKIYTRHGARGPLFGVSFANMKKLKKALKHNTALARELWATRNIDAQTLATMIADPKDMSDADLEQWVKAIKYYPLVDSFITNLVAGTAFLRDKAMRWTASDDEWVGRAGWQAVAHLAVHDDDLGDAFFTPYLVMIETSIHDRKNRTREAMNAALIAIGSRNHALKDEARRIAGIIGTVDIDHGQTGCKTPDAAAYIEKTWKRKKA